MKTIRSSVLMRSSTFGNIDHFGNINHRVYNRIQYPSTSPKEYGEKLNKKNNVRNKRGRR